MEQYSARLAKVWDWMTDESISLLMLEDTEGRRDQNIRWLTGHPGDALLFLSQSRKAILTAWDINLAKQYAGNAPVLLTAYNDFERQACKAITAASQMLEIPAGAKIEIPSVTPYPLFLDYVEKLTNYDTICRENGAGAQLKRFRAVKDEKEIEITK
jgi:Xaa-Pro dipeptidase